MNILIDKGLFSDVTLAVAGTEFKAHKAILAGMTTRQPSASTSQSSMYTGLVLWNVLVVRLVTTM